MDDRFDLVIQQREAIEAELAKRTLAHKRRVDRVKHGTALQCVAKSEGGRAAAFWTFLRSATPGSNTRSTATRPRRNTAIIPHLAQIGSPPPVILNYALHGQPTTAVRQGARTTSASSTR